VLVCVVIRSNNVKENRIVTNKCPKGNGLLKESNIM
jgi:hypothetical protein